MPISPAGRASNPPGHQSRASRGFTLIELLAVVSILAVLSLGVGLSAGGLFARPGTAASADRLEQGMTRLRDAALLGRGRLGLYPRADGWIAARLDTAGLWQPEGAPLVLRGASLAWQIEGAAYLPGVLAPAPQDAPPVQIAADGGSTPFALTLLQGATRLSCTALAGAELTCDR